MEKDIPLHIKQSAIARKAILNIDMKNNFRATNKELAQLGLPKLQYTDFRRLLKGVPSGYNRVVTENQKRLRDTTLPDEFFDDIASRENSKEVDNE